MSSFSCQPRPPTATHGGSDRPALRRQQGRGKRACGHHRAPQRARGDLRRGPGGAVPSASCGGPSLPGGRRERRRRESAAQKGRVRRTGEGVRQEGPEVSRSPSAPGWTGFPSCRGRPRARGGQGTSPQGRRPRKGDSRCLQGGQSPRSPPTPTGTPDSPGAGRQGAPATVVIPSEATASLGHSSLGWQERGRPGRSPMRCGDLGCSLCRPRGPQPEAVLL